MPVVKNEKTSGDKNGKNAKYQYNARKLNNRERDNETPPATVYKCIF